VTERLTHELLSHAGFRVAERERLRELSKEHEWSQSGAADPVVAASGTLEASAEPQENLTDLGYRKGGPGGYHQVIGRVQNTGSVLLPDPSVSLQYFDRGRNLIAGSLCGSLHQPALNGQKLPFACLFRPPPDFSYYEANLDTSGRILANRAMNLTVKNLRFRKDTGSISGD